MRRGLSTSLRAKRSNPLFLCGREMDCFAALAMTVDIVSRSRSVVRPGKSAFWRRGSGRHLAVQTDCPSCAFVASTPLADVNIDIEIDIADAGLRRAVRAALMPTALAR